MPKDEIKVEDKRFWARKAGDDAEAADDAAPPEVDPAELESLRVRAEAAERKFQDIQLAFASAKTELDRTRERLQRDAERNVELKFGDLVADLLESVDDLDRAIEHGAAAADDPVIRGVVLARERFLAALQKAGVVRLDPQDEPFDPNVAEAIGVVPVSDPERHDTVINVAQAGYKLGARIIRPARVLIGRLLS